MWNPVRQVRDYLLRTVDALKRRPRLCVDNRLRCGWGSGVVLPYLTPEEGPAPELERLDSAEGVRRHAKDWIGARLARGISPEDILVLGHNRLGMEKIAGWLDGQKIPASFLPAGRLDGTVGVSTIHSSKGLDAGHVLILNAHELDGLRTRRVTGLPSGHCRGH